MELVSGTSGPDLTNREYLLTTCVIMGSNVHFNLVYYLGAGHSAYKMNERLQFIDYGQVRDAVNNLKI